MNSHGSTVQPQISVVLSVRNGMPWLPETIDSILEQTFENFELLILDNASSDDTVPYVHLITDPRIRLILNGTDLGIHGSRNRGFELARAPFIAVMDADDICLPHRFQVQYDFLMSNPEIVVCGSNQSVFETGDIVKLPQSSAEISAAMPLCCPLSHPTIMMHKERVLKLTGGYAGNLFPVEDYDLWARLMMTGKAKFANIQQELLRYRTHPTISRTAYHEKMQIQADKVRFAAAEWICNAPLTEYTKKSFRLLVGSLAVNTASDLIAAALCVVTLVEANQISQKLEPHLFEKQCLAQWEQACHRGSPMVHIGGLILLCATPQNLRGPYVKQLRKKAMGAFSNRVQTRCRKILRKILS